MVIAGALFYATVALQTIFGPFVLNEWNRMTWIIIWEVAITLFYSALVIVSWFYYIPGTIGVEFPSDWHDMLDYIFLHSAWSEPKKKVAE